MIAEKIYHALRDSESGPKADMRAVPVENDARLMDAPIVEAQCFKASANSKFSFDENVLNSWMDSSFTELSTTDYNLVPFLWMSLKDNTPLKDRAYLCFSKLSTRGLILWRKGDPAFSNSLGMVLGSSKLGVVLIPIKIFNSREEIFTKIQFGADQFKYTVIHIVNPKDYICLVTNVMSRTELRG